MALVQGRFGWPGCHCGDTEGTRAALAGDKPYQSQPRLPSAQETISEHSTGCCCICTEECNARLRSRAMALSSRAAWCAQPNPIVHHHHHPAQLILAQVAGVCGSWASGRGSSGTAASATTGGGSGNQPELRWAVGRLQALQTSCWAVAKQEGTAGHR